MPKRNHAPRLTQPRAVRHPPEKQQHCLGEGLEVVVAVDFCGIVQRNFTKHLAGSRGLFRLALQNPPDPLAPSWP